VWEAGSRSAVEAASADVDGVASQLPGSAQLVALCTCCKISSVTFLEAEVVSIDVVDATAGIPTRMNRVAT